ncbi:DUF6602 domain-containing protein [Sinorhizobium meliloti]|uniref:DUF6602 domain-containing protein n=1 Tax=Rhizobium meliloti TaxID=382 RepID=UPI003D64A939
MRPQLTAAKQLLFGMNWQGVEMDWEALFAASALKLKSELDEARASVQHRGLKGSLNETAFSDWLRTYLPRTLEVSAGEIIDSFGGRSRQVDVVIYDATATPRFLSRGGIDVLPIEPVYGVVEVKTYLNKVEIENCFSNMEAVKALRKAAYQSSNGEVITRTTSLYGEENSNWPIQFYVFAYESDGLETLLYHMSRVNNGRPLSQRIDGVCVLDKGLLIHAGPEGLQPVPFSHTSLIAKSSGKPLLTFYALLSHLYGQAFTRPISILPYIAHIEH